MRRLLDDLAAGQSPAHTPTALALCLLVAASCLPSPLAAQGFTVAEVMSAPFPDGLVAARDADVVAWVSNDRGSRNIWLARGPEWRGEQLTFWQGDDGQEVGGLEVAPDGSWLVFTRGGAPNRQGWTPAPAQPVEGAERARWLLCIAECGARTAGGDDAPAGDAQEAAGPGVPLLRIERWGTLSPDGTHMAWARAGRIEVAPFSADGMGEAETTTIATVRGGAGQLTWSPDGSHVAFVSSRGQHSLVGVAAVDGSGFAFIDPGVTQDRSPVWSPDGARLAFIRSWAWTEPEATLPFFARPADPIPWQIVVAEVGQVAERGAARSLPGPHAGGFGVRTVFEAEPGDGSRFAGVTAAHDVWWSADDHLVFPWEKDGWKRLWSVPAEGGAPRLLTPGEHVVQHAAMAPDGRTLFFDSNRDDLDRKHIWAVRANGDDLRAITPGEGVEWAPVALASGALAFLGSGATIPARPFVIPPGSDERVAPQGPVPASFPSDELVVPTSVTFPATDGQTVFGQLFMPAGVRAGEKRPAILFFHGGSRRQMLLGFHNRGYYHNAYAMNQFLAAQGYVVLAVNYRSGVGYGLHFREAEDYGAEGASEVRDVIGAALFARSLPQVDPARVGLWGGSYGGFLTAQGLVHAPELFAAGVDIHGVHDWNEGIQNFRPDYEPENLPELSRLAFESSPMAHLDRWEDPVLLIHGDDDRNVRFTETVSLARELTLRDVPHEVLVFPDEVHGFLRHANWVRAYEATAAWFDRWLGG